MAGEIGATYGGSDAPALTRELAHGMAPEEARSAKDCHEASLLPSQHASPASNSPGASGRASAPGQAGGKRWGLGRARGGAPAGAAAMGPPGRHGLQLTRSALGSR